MSAQAFIVVPRRRFSGPNVIPWVALDNNHGTQALKIAQVLQCRCYRPVLPPQIRRGSARADSGADSGAERERWRSRPRRWLCI